jgi:anti-sigma factor RsiW
MMNCVEIKPLLDGYVDNELDLVRMLEVEKHYDTCGSCAGQIKDLQALRTTLKSARLSYRAPEALKETLYAKYSPRRRSVSAWWNLQAWVPAGAMALLFAGLYFGNGALFNTGDGRVANEVVSAHVRSLMATHLMDVASTNQHTVKPWFNGKIDFAPAVHDLAEQSFPLVGGRLDYIANEPVAALVYQRQKHVINLFIWPAPRGGDRTLHALARRGYNLITWTQAGMTYWTVSDLNARELKEFAQIYQNQVLLP